MAAPTATGGSLNTITLSTIEKYLKKMADNITERPALMRFAKKHGLIKTERLVGREEIMTIDRETNDNGRWFDDADRLSTRPTSGLIDARVGHHNYTSSFFLSDTEMMENEGAPRIRSLISLKLKTMEREMETKLSQAIRWVPRQRCTPWRPPCIPGGFPTWIGSQPWAPTTATCESRL